MSISTLIFFGLIRLIDPNVIGQRFIALHPLLVRSSSKRCQNNLGAT
ncbi:hypothetical protein [Halopseudomonas litoralis]|nr:hypothetical protein [Halopseudomonas litoralis]